MISVCVLYRSFNFFVGEDDVYILMLLLINDTSRNTKNYIDYHRKM